ncbi:scarecrow-like protein 34 [Hordeum vulgare]|uniref:Scarecrow-like protein 9 n=1 Tax=Hordeum vulgare subsp. vulgare TaxID=112509 RepID=A0A8I6YD14_HORVV|nr:scarecrow-like protein 34 [Hordeum vulgare subsp. vulgare]KAE8769137.1 scarecrow-like protein 34 [Hordeum vulgare]
MDATPEEFEPLSPSLFLDLPPTPPPAADVDLDFISRMLMEEDIDDKFFYQYPDQPAILDAQRPYEQIISDITTASSGSPNGTASSDGNTISSINAATTSSSEDTNYSWPYDPLELSQLLRSPPYLDDMVFGGLVPDSPADEDARNSFLSDPPAAGFQQSPAQFNGAADGASANGGSPGTQNSAILNGPAGEKEAKPKPAMFSAGDGGQDGLLSAFFSNGGDMEMLNMAFLKGMEEANKFLPTNNTLLEAFPRKERGFTAKKEEGANGALTPGNGRGRRYRYDEDDPEAETARSSKLMMPDNEETGAREMLDEIMLEEYEMCMQGIQELRVAMDSEAKKNNGKAARAKRGASEAVDLRTMLIHCAQAVAAGDRRGATELLKQIKQHSGPTGDATQRLAHCFAEGLEARLAGTGSQIYQSLVAKRTSVVEFLKAYKLFMAACCFKKVNFGFANKTILNAVAGKRRLHIVDFGVQYGFQWPGLMRCLAQRDGGPPEVRITGIDLPQPGFRPAGQIDETGRRLSSCARELGVPFRFHGVAARWDTVRASDLRIDPGEVLVVYCQCGLSNLMDDSVAVTTNGPSPRDVVLRNIRDMRPDVFVECVANGGYGAPFFVTRFREALFFYSAHFDMLDATIPRYNDVRLLIERDIIGRAALNVIACEGADRVDRPETYRQWQARNRRAGFRQLPLDPEVVGMVREKVREHYHKDFLIDVDHQWLLQGWKGRVLYALSTWVAEDDS